MLSTDTHVVHGLNNTVYVRSLLRDERLSVTLNAQNVSQLWDAGFLKEQQTLINEFVLQDSGAYVANLVRLAYIDKLLSVAIPLLPDRYEYTAIKAVKYFYAAETAKGLCSNWNIVHLITTETREGFAIFNTREILATSYFSPQYVLMDDRLERFLSRLVLQNAIMNSGPF